MPDKTMVYPELLPERFLKVREDDLYATPQEYQAVLDSFDKYGVQYYDVFPQFLGMKENNPYPVFSATGLHWNLPSAAEVANGILARISET